MKYGLSDAQFDELIQILSTYPEIEEAVLFGSRALGTYKEASDVDIALKGEKVTAALAAKLKYHMEEETYQPFFYDFVAYPKITNKALKEHIDGKGVSIYRRGWREVTIDQIKAESPNALATGPFGSAISSKFFTDRGVPVIRGGNLSADISTRLSDQGLVFISEEKAKEFKRSEVRKGDLIFTCWGTINQIGLIDGRGSYPVYIISNKQMKLTPHPKKADSFFLYYYFSSPQAQEEILGNNIGSSVPGFNLGQLKTMELNLPPLPEQKAIASVFSSLDDKIELLHRQNKTLEAMAETIFRQWFVEEAQEEWAEGILQDVISVKGGTTPSTKESEFWDGEIYWSSPRDLSNHTSVFLFDTERKITEKGLAKIGSGLLPEGTVLLSSRAPIGYLAITEIPLSINQGYIAIICDKLVSNYFMFLWCKTNMELIKNSGNGSVFQEIAKSVFREINITIPPSPLLDDFDKAIRPIFHRIKINQIQIRTLEKLRDTLLPKLMRGEVRVEYKN